MKYQSMRLSRSAGEAPLKIEFLHEKECHLTAIHLFTPGGLYSYNGPANEFPIAPDHRSQTGLKPARHL